MYAEHDNLLETVTYFFIFVLCIFMSSIKGEKFPDKTKSR
jgi:hypothetical protein